eukprot:m.246973 g.246973  ORF g.246973 m.246973 type:complete len:174 (+) comp16122_c0_seq5:53-574(+)
MRVSVYLLRFRQHVNPLSHKFQRQIDPISVTYWNETFDDSRNPLFVDIGCNRGLMLRTLSSHETSWNFLGVDIRDLFVNKSNKQADIAAPRNLAYLCCNANIHLKNVLHNYPGPICGVSVFFPDPWHQKKRFAKRRVINNKFLEMYSFECYFLLLDQCKNNHIVRKVIKNENT